MKRNSHNYTLFLLFIFFLVLSSSFLASARVLQNKSQQGSVQESKDDTSTTDNNEDNISNLMGMEKSEGCGNTEEECNSDRKLEEEAHLDYIYTQKHRRP